MKPELLHDARIATKSDTAQLLYYKLLGIVDDHGRAQADPVYLHGQAFWGAPRSIRKVKSALAELVSAKILRIYSANGAQYLEILEWNDPTSLTHQRISHPQPSALPGPSDDPSTHPPHDPADDQRNGRGSVPSQPVPGPGSSQVPGPEPFSLDASDASPGQDLKATIDAFHVRYLAAYGNKPTWGPAPSKLLKNLIAQHGATEVQRRIAILFESPPSWLEPPFTVKTLISSFDRLVLAAVRKGPIPARHPNAPADFFGELDAARDDMKAKGAK